MKRPAGIFTRLAIAGTRIQGLDDDAADRLGRKPKGLSRRGCRLIAGGQSALRLAGIVRPGLAGVYIPAPPFPPASAFLSGTGCLQFDITRLRAPVATHDVAGKQLKNFKHNMNLAFRIQVTSEGIPVFPLQLWITRREV